jgi:hypothetical protein
MCDQRKSRCWQAELVARHPGLFEIMVDGRPHRGYPTVGDGWRELVETAVGRIALAVSQAPCPVVKIVQIKEKVATLRIHWRAGRTLPQSVHDAVQTAVDLAEARSACTCETCGAPGRLFDDGGRYATACDAHARGTSDRTVPERANVHLCQVRRGGTLVVRARRYLRDADSFVDVDPSSLPPEDDQTVHVLAAARVEPPEKLI